MNSGAPGKAGAVQPGRKPGPGRAVAGRPVASVAWWKVTTTAEASTAIMWGMGMSHEMLNAGAEAFAIAEGKMSGTVMRGAVPPAGV